MSRSRYDTYEQVVKKCSSDMPEIPYSENFTLSTLIDSISEAMSPSLLIKIPTVVQALKTLQSKFADFPDLYVPGHIAKVLDSITCKKCKNIGADIHSCGAVLCNTCVKEYDFKCLNCNDQIPPSFMLSLFGFTGKCLNCGDGLYTSCKHLCFSCLLKFQGNCLLGDNPCPECKTLFCEIKSSSLYCHSCAKYYPPPIDRYVFICQTHFFCPACTAGCIDQGECKVCATAIPPKTLFFAYEGLHDCCSECQSDVLYTELKIRRCCNRNVCDFCFDNPCPTHFPSSFPI
jgi:hypothetical protein